MGSASLRVCASDTKDQYIKARMASCSATLNAASVTCCLRRKRNTHPSCTSKTPTNWMRHKMSTKVVATQFLGISHLFVVVLLLMEVSLHAYVMVFLCLTAGASCLTVVVCISFCWLRQPQLVSCHAAVVSGLFFFECLLCLCS